MVRLDYVPRLAAATETFFMDANLIAIWSAVEPGLGIIASSLATLRPLFRGLFRTANPQNPSIDNTTSRFPSFRKGSLVKELPLPGKRSDVELGARFDSFDFIQVPLPQIKPLPQIPHQHIPEARWSPGAVNTHRTSSSMFSASELFGEDWNLFPRPSESMIGTAVVRTHPQLGNFVSCEGPVSSDVEKRYAIFPKPPSKGSLHEPRKLGSA